MKTEIALFIISRGNFIVCVLVVDHPFLKDLSYVHFANDLYFIADFITKTKISNRRRKLARIICTNNIIYF